MVPISNWRAWARIGLGILATLSFASVTHAGTSEFRRGDFNGDAVVDIVDAVSVLNYLFVSGEAPGCLDAIDVDDTGSIEVTDVLYMLAFLFQMGTPPPAPGPNDCGPDPTADSLGCETSPCVPITPPGDLELGQVVNRLAYGPSDYDLARIAGIGIGSYVEEQLDPASIDESTNDALNAVESEMFELRFFTDDTLILAEGDTWSYFKGTQEPPANWNDPGFDASSWLTGSVGIGYGDGDDRTELDDMRGFYTSVYLLSEFTVDDPSAVDQLVLSMDYDDGFVAYVNGVEVGRENMSGSPPLFSATADGGHEAGSPIDVEIDLATVVPGINVLAIQVHNTTIDSSDLTALPELLTRESTGIPPRLVIGGVGELKTLPHIRGVYARRQLQTVLAEFWENHFTTDLDKLENYFDDLEDSDGTDSMGDDQAEREAAQVEYEEYQFFTDNALGYFGDMLLYSATSPSMLVYLDAVSNVAGDPNENYAREILELSTMGVDNGYTQADIEELARCFTGWTVTKVPASEAQAFPQSAENPPTADSIGFQETLVVAIGQDWRYFKGLSEPTPVGVDPGTAWSEIGFDDSAWLLGPTGIGYGDGDDETVLDDMQGAYLSVYSRHEFDVVDPSTVENLFLRIQYDDGFVAYLNGVEVARSDSMSGNGTPPAFDEGTGQTHEANGDPDVFNLSSGIAMLVPGTNVLAIQGHNANLGSSDFSMLPELLTRQQLPGGIELGNESGIWAFRFNPAQHDTTSKVIFPGSPFEVSVPAGRLGLDGLQDARDVIDALVSHPETAEYICIKLIQKFVSDEINLTTFEDQTAPLELRILLADMVAAWYSTTPNGHVGTVMEALLDPVDRSSVFWDPTYYRAKVKTPVEMINSTLRALEADVNGSDLARIMADAGMELFTRNDPDGWSEVGSDWIGTGGLLENLNFIQRFVSNDDNDYSWDLLGLLDTEGLVSAGDVIDYFDSRLFHDTLPAPTRSLLVDFATTDAMGDPLTLDPTSGDYDDRIAELISLILSMPHWTFQ